MGETGCSRSPRLADRGVRIVGSESDPTRMIACGWSEPDSDSNPVNLFLTVALVFVGGELAVMTGSLLFKTRQSGSADIAAGRAFCTQVLARTEGRWLFPVQQLTRLKEA